MNTNISSVDLLNAAHHIYDSFRDAIDKRNANFRGTQSLYMSQIQALQIVVLNHRDLFQALDSIYYLIDSYTPPAFSVLHESNLPVTADSRRPSALSVVPRQGGTYGF